MKNRHEKRAAKLVKKLYREEEGIMWAEKAVNGISRDYLKFAREMNETKSRWDLERQQNKIEKEVMAKGLSQGMEKGMAEGKTERTLEIAQKMKAANRPLTEIAEFTGLSLEAIEKL